jgi:single-stranded-DNA-specific exonuclease
VALGPAQLVDARVVGAGGHVRLTLAGRDGARVNAVAFGAADGALGAALLAGRGRALVAAGRVVRDDWGGRRGAELHVDDAAWTP